MIDDYYISIDLASQEVAALNTVYESDIEDLVQGNYYINNNIVVYSTSDEVVYLLYPEEAIARKRPDEAGRTNGLFCGESGAGREKVDYSFYITPRFRQNNKIVYQKLGIYFSLLAKTKLQYKSDLGFWISNDDCSQYIEYYYQYKPKCRSSRLGSGVQYDGGSNECDNTLKYRPYESIRGLHNYFFGARFFGHGSLSDGFEIRNGI